MSRFFKETPLLVALISTVVVCVIISFIVIVAPAQKAFAEARNLLEVADGAQKAWKAEDLDQLETELLPLHESIKNTKSAFANMKYLQRLPVIRVYAVDLQNALTSAEIVTKHTGDLLADLQPFAPLLGFGSESEVDRADQKLEQLVQVAPSLIPSIELIVDDVNDALPYLSSIHWERYPDTEQLPLRSTLEQVVTVASGLKGHMETIKPLLVNFPAILGEPEPKTYVILFQNDKELRPTGGFITSFAMLTADSGQITISDAKNIYEISTNEGFLPPPAPIITHLKVSAWHLRDTNFSPDYKESMETFDYYWRNMGQPVVDGYIAIDTQFVQALLEMLGPVEVPGYTVDFTLIPGTPAECDEGGTLFTAENVVCRLEFYAQRLTNEQTERKDVIGKLMDEIYNKLMGAPSDQWLPLSETLTTEFAEKHAVAYMKDPVFQGVVEGLGWAGRVQEAPEDYLHISDANLAGLKSDMYIERSVNQTYEIADDGTVTKKVSITYENTGAFDGWLNATGRNYVRMYVPLGSELVDVEGGQHQTDVYEDLGKTVFDNFMLVPPLQSSTITFTYTLPFKADDAMSLLLQKQPGIDHLTQTILFNGDELTFELRKDEKITLRR